MNERGKPPATHHKFDYFGEHAPLIARRDGDNEPEGDPDAEGPSQTPGKIKRGVTVVVTLLFLGVMTWFMSGYLDAARYAFSPVTEPLQLGDVKDITPDQIPHNTYVRIHGITEHRGLRQQMVRGLAFVRDEYWYFRLLGSRGVFIEVLPDGDRYGPATEVTVAGRAVDPRRASVYADLLASYETLFVTENKAETRVILVGMRPGEHRWPFVAAFSVLCSLGLANIIALIRLFRPQ